MENEPTIGQPIPTAVLTPTEIITPPEPMRDTPPMDARAQPVSNASMPPLDIFTELMFAPVAFWASLAVSYFELFGATASAREVSQPSL